MPAAHEHRLLAEVGPVGSDPRVSANPAHAELAGGSIHSTLSWAEVTGGKLVKGPRHACGDVADGNLARASIFRRLHTFLHDTMTRAFRHDALT